MRKYLPALAAAAALLAAAAACADGTGAEGLAPGYVLETVDGQALPFDRYNQTLPDGSQHVATILADSIEFTSDTAVARSMAVRYITTVPGTAPFDFVSRTVVPGRYWRRNNVVFVTWRLTDGGGSVYDTLWVRSGRLTGSERLGLDCTVCVPVHAGETVYRPR